MTSYADQFDALYGLDDKSSVGAGNTTAEGFREPPLTEGSWSVDSEGRHAHSDTSDGTNPIDPDYRMEDLNDFVHHLFALASHLNYLTSWDAADKNYQFNDDYNHNFAYWATFEITGASGSTITIDTSGIDYRSVGVDTRGTIVEQEGGGKLLEYETVNKPFPFVNDMVVFDGNSALAGKVIARVLDATLGSGQMTLTLDQAVSYGATKLDSGGATPTCTIYRNAKSPERVPKIETLNSFWGKYETIVMARSSGVYTFTVQSGGQDIGIAWPYVDGQDGWAGTLKVEVSTDGGTSYSDITKSLRYEVEGKAGYFWEPYVSCTHKSGGGWTTTLDLTGKISDAVTHVRVRVVRDESDKTVAGVHAPTPGRCQYCQECVAKMAGKYAAQGTNGVDTTADGRHWYCSKRDDATSPTPAANLDDFRGGECWQWDCPNFEIATPGNVGSLAFARLVSGLGELLYQLAPGNANITNFLHLMVDFPGVLFQLTPTGVIGTNNGANMPSYSYFSGRYVLDDGVETDESDNESIKIVAGADYNHNFDGTTLNWGSNRWPADAQGIVQRRLGTTYRPGSQLERITDQSEATLDPNYTERALPVCRTVSPARRFSRNGNDLPFSARNVAGLEGEHRVQRVNRGTQRTISGLEPAKSVSPVDKGRDHWKRWTGTIGGKAVVGYIQFQRPGTENFGYKRVGGVGLNANVYRMESLGSGLYKIHCAPTRWVSHQQGVGVDVVSAFWGGGGVVEPPWPYRVNASVYNYLNNRMVYGTRHKACRGDVVEFVGIDGAEFPVTVAEAFSGDLMVGKTFDRLVQSGQVGSFLNFDALRTDGDEVIEITALEVDTGSGWANWFDASTPAVNAKAYADRPTENTMTAGDTSSAYVDQDKVELAYDPDVYVAISSIVDGSAPNYPPVITTATAHGLETNDRAVIWDSDSTPSVDGTWVVIKLNATQFVLSTTVFASNRITVSGTSGKLSAVGANTVIRGSMKGFLSFEMLRMLWATSAGLLLATTGQEQVRATVNVDGQAEATPVAIAVKMPRLVLSEPLDTSRIATLRVYALDERLGDEPVELTYGGAGDPWDLTIRTSFTTFYYDSSSQALTFHPNMAGAVVWVDYPTTTTVDLGDLPVGVAENVATEDVSGQPHFKYMDTLIVRDEMGVIEALGASAFAGLDFYIKTSAKMVHEDLANYGSEASSYLDEDDVGAGYQALVEGTDIHTHWTQGRVYLTATGFAKLPAAMTWRTLARFVNAGVELPVELLRCLVALLDCLDTVEITGGFTGFDNVNGEGLALYSFDSYDTSTGGSPIDFLEGNIIMGYNQAGISVLTAAEKIYGLSADGGVPSNMLTQEAKYTAGGLGGYTIWVGAHPDVSGGVNQIAGYLLAPIFQFVFDDFVRKLPAGSEIVSCKVEATLSADFEQIDYIGKSIMKNGNVSAPQDNYFTQEFWQTTDADHPYSVPSGYSEVTPGETLYSRTKTEDLEIGFIVGGRRQDGRWQALGSFDAGTMQPGETKVIDMAETMAAILGAKNSTYEYIGLIPTGLSGGGISVSLDENGDNDKDLMKALLESVTISEDYEFIDNQADNKRFVKKWCTLTGSEIQGSSFTFGDIVLRFKLPSGVVEDLKVIPEGSISDMSPV